MNTNNTESSPLEDDSKHYVGAHFKRIAPSEPESPVANENTYSDDMDSTAQLTPLREVNAPQATSVPTDSVYPILHSASEEAPTTWESSATTNNTAEDSIPTLVPLNEVDPPTNQIEPLPELRPLETQVLTSKASAIPTLDAPAPQPESRPSLSGIPTLEALPSFEEKATAEVFPELSPESLGATGDLTENPFEAQSTDSFELDSTASFGAQQQDIPASINTQPAAYVQPDEPKKRRIWPFVVCGVVGALAIIYVGFAIFFQSHFLPNTKVNGEDVSWKGVDELAAHIHEQGAQYKVHVTGDGIDLSIPSKDIDFAYDGDAYAEEAGNQIPAWQWPREVAYPQNYSATGAISFDEAKLDKIVRDEVAKVNKKAKGPKNATMTFSEEEDKFVTVPDALGTKIEPDPVVKKVSKTVQTMQPEAVLGDEELVQPTIREDNETLLAGVDKANMLLDSDIHLNIAGTDAKALTRDQIRSWVSLNSKCNLTVNEDAIREWAQGPLSEEFDTVGNARTYTRPDGKEITVDESAIADNGSYGWVLDGESLAATIASNLREGKTDAIDVPMLRTADSWNPNGKEWPNRYIDVDLAEQVARMYDDSSKVIWETSFVSGNPIYDGGTHPGAYYIFEKESPMILIGLDYNMDGKPDYETPVTYWMPFNDGQGLHDANWRWSFGGEIYTYDGSHGCVNLPYDKAQELYNITEVGDVVVVHW